MYLQWWFLSFLSRSHKCAIKNVLNLENFIKNIKYAIYKCNIAYYFDGNYSLLPKLHSLIGSYAYSFQQKLKILKFFLAL